MANRVRDIGSDLHRRIAGILALRPRHSATVEQPTGTGNDEGRRGGRSAQEGQSRLHVKALRLISTQAPFILAKWKSFYNIQMVSQLGRMRMRTHTNLSNFSHHSLFACMFMNILHFNIHTSKIH